MGQMATYDSTHPVLIKREFRNAWAAQAMAVPHGRAQLLRRYGSFSPAIRLAPYSD